MIRCLSLVSLMLCANPAQAGSPRAERPKMSTETSPQLGRLALQVDGFDGMWVEIIGPEDFRPVMQLPLRGPWMERVPPGNYRWLTYGPGFPSLEGVVDVKSNQTTTIKIDQSLKPSPTMGETASKEQGVTWSTLTPSRKKTLIGAGAMAVVFSGTSIALLLRADREEEKNMARVLAGIFTAVPILVTTIKWFAEP